MPSANSKPSYALRSRWPCIVPNVDLNTWLFTSPTAPLPTSPIFIDAEKPSTHTLSLTTYRSLVKRVARGLVTAGLRPGDRVLIFSGNNVYFPIFFLATVAAGGIFTGANPSYTSRELAFQLQNAGAHFLVAHEGSIDIAVEAADSAGLARRDVFSFDDTLVIKENSGGRGEYWEGDRGRALGAKLGIRHWSAIVADSEDFAWKVFSTEEECHTTAAINYSSGTTGLPKGVELSHRNYVANAETVTFNSNLSPSRLALPHRSLGILPMYHAYGQTYGVLNLPSRNIPCYIVAGKFDFVKFLHYIQKFQITGLNCVPPIMVALAKHPAVDKYDLSSVRSIGCGAAPLAGDIQREVKERLTMGGKRELQIKQGWGMTEATCSVMGHHPDDDTEDGGSVGELMANCEAKVVNPETGEELPAKGAGELWIRAPNVCKGYWQNEKATKELFAEDGWMRTGDIGYVDLKGNWYIVDRMKELIKVRGLQVAPAELEGVILEHPAVADVAVIGLPFAGDERPRAYVVPKEGAKVSGEDIVKWVEDKCARHKWITGGVVFVDVVPKNPSGKILRRQLRDRAKTEVTDTGDFRAKL